MASIRPWLLLVLRRMGDERALIAAALLVAVVAAAVSAACVIYPDVMTRRGLVAVLDGADPASSSVVVSVGADAVSVGDVDAEVTAAIGEALGPAAGELVRTARSGSWELPGGAGLDHPPLTAFAWDEGLEARTTLVAGTRAAPGSAGQVEAEVTTGAAAALGVRPGDRLEVTSRLDRERRLVVLISGVVEVTDPTDSAWAGDRLVLDGSAQPGSFPLRGPLFVGRETLLEDVVDGEAALAWRALPAFERIGPEDVPRVRAGVAGLEARLAERLGSQGPVTVATGLPAILDSAGAGIAAGRSGTAIIALQLLVLATYALVLLASLVVAQRRAATALGIARGATTANVLGLAALEGVLVAVPAVVLGPPLAVLLVGLVAGTEAGTAVPAPRLTVDAVGLALLAGAATVVGMTLPVAAAVGPVATLRGAIAGRGTRGLAERTGIDVALLVLAGLALWQLRENGTPLARAAGGGAGVDPLLAAAPAIGLLAGGILALRVGPLIGSWLERPAGGATGTVASLAARGVARRSLEAGRAALLLVVATGILVFAGAYALTWEQSQRDQVAAQLPADLVGRAPSGPGAPPDWVLRDALRALPGVSEAIPAVREAFAVGSAVPRGELVGAPAGPAAALATIDDGPGTALEVLLGQLAAERPTIPTLAVPAGATALRLRLDVALEVLPGPDGAAQAVPDAWTGLGTAVVVRDGDGLLHRLTGATGRLAGGTQELEVPLVGPDVDGSDRLPEPISLVAVENALTLPEGLAATGAVRLAGATALTAAPDAETVRADLDLGPATPAWGAVRSTFGVPPTSLSAAPGGALTATLDEPVVGPVPVVVGFRATGAATLPDLPVAALVDASTRDAAGVAVGDVIAVQRGISTVTRVRVAGVVDVLPGIAAGPGGLLVDLPTLELGDYARDGDVAAPDEWWLGAASPAEDLAPAALAAGELGLTDVRVRADVLRDRLADPLARGSRGALGLAAAAALFFGGVGFAAAAWHSLRTRRPELAVARALGVGRGQATTWMALELAFQLVVGIAGGIALGVVLAWAVLPSVALTPDGSLPVPAPRVVVPWDLAAFVALAGAVAFGAVLLALRRAGSTRTLADDLREAAS